MAAPTFPTSSSLPNTSFVFDIHQDGAALPTGQCNYLDISHGANAARCGCRRFWSRLPVSGGRPVGRVDSEQEICMCSHHACFHDAAQVGRTHAAAAAAATATAAGVFPEQENERPRGNRDPLSPIQDLAPFHIPSHLDLAAVDFSDLHFHMSPGGMNVEASPVAPKLPTQSAAGAVAPSAQESELPDTLSWNHFVQSQDAALALPPIPSQCLMPSGPPSTTSSSQMRFVRPFGGRGLDTLSSVPKPRGVHVNTAAWYQPGGSATPGIVVEDAAEGDALGGAPTPVIPDTQVMSQLPQSGSSAGVSKGALREMVETVHSHENRIDKLENTSFSVAGHEECQERHDHLDVRVAELESRVDDVEKRIQDDGTNSTVTGSRRVLLRDDDATISVASVATNQTTGDGGASDPAIFSQLQSLQAQVSSLQAVSLPTYSNPWELEVVLLPFPVKGIWLGKDELVAAQRRLVPCGSSNGGGGDDWTQMPNTLSRQTPEPQLPVGNEWADDDSGWLMPRACVPGRMIDKRLKSRGLIKTVLVKGSDARSIQLAIHHAFSSVLYTMMMQTETVLDRSSSSRLRHHALVDKYIGLRQAWIPLRKIHKDSRLRFLSPGEMSTPSLWDVAFLRSSVIMKATGVHRLYVTQPEAYLQDAVVVDKDVLWSWQKLRELSRVYDEQEEAAAAGSFASQGSNGAGKDSQGGVVPEADAAEACWAWNDRLDEAPVSVSVSLSHHQQQQDLARALSKSRSSGSSQQFFTGRQSPIVSATAARAQSPFTSSKIGRRASGPPHVRTNSVPPTAGAGGLHVHSPIGGPGGQGKRRVASLATTSAGAAFERRSSPFLASTPRVTTGAKSPTSGGSGAWSVTKQRRGATRSPSIARPRRTTPRWSMERSPSVALPDFPAAGGGQGQGQRGSTPFCYATPFSNAPMETTASSSSAARRGANGSRAGSRGPTAMGGYDDYMDCGSDTDPYDSQMTYLDEIDDDDDDEDAGNDDELDFPVYEDEDDELDDVDTDREIGSGGGQALRSSQEWRVGVGVRADQGQGQQQNAQMLLGPEDEPWPGIEDEEDDDGEDDEDVRIGQDENMHIYGGGGDRTGERDAHGDDGEGDGQRDDDQASDVSSQPSEYPSTRRAWHMTQDNYGSGGGGGRGRGGKAGVGFRIHEDPDVDLDIGDAQGTMGMGASQRN